MDGHVDVWIDKCNGESFLWPNDLCFGPDGCLYLTDSGILFGQFRPGGGRIRPDIMSFKIDGRVYRINVQTKEIWEIDEGIRFANGICFGPDNNLYVAETITGTIYRYEWANGKIGTREVFGNVIDPSLTGDFKGPDGMKFGSNGNLYVTVPGQGHVTVLAANGSVVARIRTRGLRPTNIAFGPPGENKVFVTEVQFGAIEVFDVETDGLPLFT